MCISSLPISIIPVTTAISPNTMTLAGVINNNVWAPISTPSWITNAGQTVASSFSQTFYRCCTSQCDPTNSNVVDANVESDAYLWLVIANPSSADLSRLSFPFRSLPTTTPRVLLTLMLVILLLYPQHHRQACHHL